MKIGKGYYIGVGVVVVSSLCVGDYVMRTVIPGRERSSYQSGYMQGVSDSTLYQKITGHPPTPEWIIANQNSERKANQSDIDWVKQTDLRAELFKAQNPRTYQTQNGTKNQ